MGLDVVSLGLAKADTAKTRVASLDRGLELHNHYALRPWYAALGNRFFAPAKFALHGSSTVEGNQATQYGYRAGDRLLQGLRVRHPVPGITGGFGYIPAYDEVTNLIDATTTVGAPTTLVTGGMGKKMYRLNAGQSVTWTFTGTSFQLHFLGSSTGAVAGISIDGGVATLFNTFLAASKDGLIYTSGALSAGSHTVTVTRDASTTNGAWSVFAEGLSARNGDENAGIHMYEAGHSGYSSLAWIDPAGSAYTRWTDALAAVNPHLVVMVPHLNDFTDANSTAAISTANVKDMIATLRAKITTDPAFMIVLPWERPTGGLNDPWSAYREATYQMVASDPGLALLDVGARIGSQATDIWGLWHADAIHLTNKGHALLGDILASALSI